MCADVTKTLKEFLLQNCKDTVLPTFQICIKHYTSLL